MSLRAFFDIGVGDKAAYFLSCAEFEATEKLLHEQASIYGLPSELHLLTQEECETLQQANPSAALCFAKPPSFLLPRLTFTLDPAVKKATENFRCLCTGEKGMAKSAPGKRLHYKDSPIHRIVSNFVAQGGDITRGDGSGGDSIFNGKFNDDKEGLKKKAQRGSLCMANSGRNSNTSQYFIVITEDPIQLQKLNGKYVIFGQVEGDATALDGLSQLATADGKPKEKVWIEDCGLLS